MKAETVLKRAVGWLEDVTVEEVNFECHTDSTITLETYALDEEIDPKFAITYFYARNDDGFYWGHFGAEDYVHISYMDALFGVMEDTDITDEFLVDNSDTIGEMITVCIIADKDMFQSYWVLTSYAQIYNNHPAIKSLRDYLTEYYDTYINHTVKLEKEACAS